MRIQRKIIEINEELCDGCGQCVPGCAEGALQIVDGKARLLAEKYCDGLGACLGECPTGALTIVERSAEDFDEQAVEAYLQTQKVAAPTVATPCGCPSAQLQNFAIATPCETANRPVFAPGPAGNDSALNHWPVQIRLVPPTAPFLKGADLLVAADCTPAAYPHFHRDFLRNRALMLGCPKFDDPQSYIEKFTEVFKTAGIKSITLAIMEVPCCAGMQGIVKEALARSGCRIPVEVVVVGARGGILRREKW